MRVWLLAAVGVCGFSTAGAAQSSLQVPIQFDFLNPSARSLGLGGAFVGLADDATAALVNPAGLIALTRREMSAEGRYRRFTQPFLSGGRLSGTATGQGQDVVAGPEFDRIGDSSVGPSFVSFVYPRGRSRLAVFGHELIRVDQAFSSRGPFQSRGFDTRDTALSATRTLTIDSFGASLAVEAGRVWMGAGLHVHRFSMGFEFDRYLHQSFYGAPDPRQSLFHFSQSGRGLGVGGVLGVVVPITIGKIGVSYRRAPRFGFTSFSGGLVGSQERSTATFKTPDTIAVGFSAPLGSAFLVSTEYTRVFHSQLRSDYIDVLVNQGESRNRADRFTIDDAGEAHVGAEYLLPVAGRPGIRAGLWFDPDHSVRYSPTEANDLLDERISATLSSGRDLWHYTFGAMLALTPRIDLSVGVDRSSRSTLLSTSVSVRF